MKEKNTNQSAIDDLCGPWKCMKCDIAFIDGKEMLKHWTGTAAYSPLEHTTFFHNVVDRDGDYVGFSKPQSTHN